MYGLALTSACSEPLPTGPVGWLAVSGWVVVAPASWPAAPELDDVAPELDDAAPELDDAAPELDDAAPELDDAAPELEEAPAASVLAAPESDIVPGMNTLPPAPPPEPTQPLIANVETRARVNAAKLAKCRAAKMLIFRFMWASWVSEVGG